jgi:hypothetical protein
MNVGKSEPPTRAIKPLPMTSARSHTMSTAIERPRAYQPVGNLSDSGHARESGVTYQTLILLTRCS